MQSCQYGCCIPYRISIESRLRITTGNINMELKKIIFLVFTETNRQLAYNNGLKFFSFEFISALDISPSNKFFNEDFEWLYNNTKPANAVSFYRTSYFKQFQVLVYTGSILQKDEFAWPLTWEFSFWGLFFTDLHISLLIKCVWIYTVIAFTFYDFQYLIMMNNL